MKFKLNNRLFLLCLTLGSTVSPLIADPVPGYNDGLFLNKPGTSSWTAYLLAWDTGTNSRSVGLAAESGGIHLYSGRKESANGIADGGITIEGNSITLVLDNAQGPNGDNANFNV
jgi:hypothetical protein